MCNGNEINIDELFAELSAIPQIEAIAIGGSRAGDKYDQNSDYDVYVYYKGSVESSTRRDILTKYCTVMEIGNTFWETEDNCTLKNGIDIDIIWRDLDDFISGISSVVDSCNAGNGYTTCMWHNLKNSRIIYDRDGRLLEAQKKYSCDYPKQLRDNIVTRNMALLRRQLPAYEMQIKKAVKRNDRISINHRVSAFLESYFDIIFAINGLTHPGEKRIMQYCLSDCKLLPKNFEDNINQLFDDMAGDNSKVVEDIGRIIMELEQII